MIGKLLLIDLSLIDTRLKDISDQIDESLQQKFTRTKDSDTYVNNLELKFK